MQDQSVRWLLRCAACAMLAAAVPILALSQGSNYICDETWEIWGCSPGGYACCADTSYACQTSGTSLSKIGSIFPYFNCIVDVGAPCETKNMLCQQDTYWKNADCTDWCNAYMRYARGCLPWTP
ncbi:hypothetical protein RAS1_27930 [Phycisphaerae bacterium RAS1]|nr:hypothetical protein RAS1_27930 [Phycisphaerae bacterium RAS1]